ncbi:MAG: cobalt-precorrin 5A hydrolase [Bacillota bacterium]
MKLAVIALTENGAEISLKLKKLEEIDSEYKIDLYFNEKIERKEGRTFNSLKSLIKKIFFTCDGLIMVMALGIVVRVISPYLQNKKKDPAVITMDEKGENVISTLSGHLGGANELTQLIAELLQANPVITTASDTQNKMSFDMIAKKYNMEMVPFENLTGANSALVNNREINLYAEPEHKDMLSGLIEYVNFLPLSELEKGIAVKEVDFSVIISNDSLDIKKDQLQLIPRNLVIGIGCRKGVEKEQIEKAVKRGLALTGKSIKSIKNIATIDLKKEERGILEFSRKLEVPVDIISRQQIQECDFEYTKSSFVKEKIGVGGVCEPAAMISTQKGKLILEKTIVDQVTVAIVEKENYI